MASSILGKRTRNSVANESIAPPSRRAKRHASTEIYNDENYQVFEGRSTRAKARNLEEAVDKLSCDLSSRASLPKQSVKPTKITTHFHVVKACNDENAKPVQITTPSTPRHRDAFSKKVPFTPRHRVIVNGIALTPKTPRTPLSPGAITIYNVARQLFSRSSDPGRLVGRHEERKELTEFIDNCIGTLTGGSTYVSGPPGTGKSAMVKEVTADFIESETVKTAYINCMSMKTSRDIYAFLLDALCPGIDVCEGEEMKTLQRLFTASQSGHPTYVVTLDEIDHILTLDLEFIYQLFEWSLRKPSRLVLIGIANALDLTDRLLPRLKARNLKPQLLPFLPYTASQIKNIITTRLQSLMPTSCAIPGYVPFLHPAAIELCSRKVSSQTGDLRKALDICRRAIDVIESETKQKLQETVDQQVPDSPSRKPLGENTNLSSPSMSSPGNVKPQKTLQQLLAALTVETAPRASIGHLNKVTSAAFSNGANQRLKTLNLQQKAALCALIALEKRKRESASNVMATPCKPNHSAPTIKVLYDTYCMLCRRDSVLHPLTSTEFRDIVGSLETLSLISAVDGRNGSFVNLSTPSKRGRKAGFGGGVGLGDEKRVASCIGEREIQQAIEGIGADILRSILEGEGLN